MTDKKIIAVVGATGQQGGGLARAILADPDGPFVLRAVTRSADSPAAKDLAAQGAEVVEASLDDESSMRTAFEGAYGAFVVTNFWVQRTPEEEQARTRAQMELDQAAIAARAAKDAGLKHVVWSTLEDTRPHFDHLGSELPTLLDVYKVPHFDAKGEANAFFTDLGVPTTFLQTTFYYESFLIGQGPHRDENGRLVLMNPMGDSVMALVSSEDIGRTAYGIFLAGAKYIGRTVGLAGAHATGTELAELFTKVLGEKVDYRPLTHDEVRASDTPGAVEIANMFQFYAEASEYFVGSRNLDLVRELNPRLKPLEEWLTEHKNEIPLG
ncbi:NmrA/HSCARG family protein [Amycolatopsis echigonensis]|uniref:NmrA/HSCARG family protein n=1 Tax=Amycolatopsis echigonensis TaxID=2576905 RepID=A0A8E2B9I1_9PSEU|nr:NmrA/HSCARG family protein [Amycolatopsis echigonensis]MBB2506146.1 NmrA/HSCARG family protein [Amycolatopsis echigonensis]